MWDNAADPNPSLVAARGMNVNDSYYTAEPARTLSPEQLADYKKLYASTLAGLSDAITGLR